MRIEIPPEAPVCLPIVLVEAWKLLEPRIALEVAIGTPPTHSGPVPGVVGFSFEPPPREGTAGLSRMWRGDDLTVSAHVWVDQCDTRLVAHELGHVLGLHDVDDPGRVMHWVVTGLGYDFSAAEKRHLQLRPLEFRP